MLYFRRVVGRFIEWHVTTAAGSWFAVVKKHTEDDPKSWSICFERSKNASPLESDLDLETAFERVELQYAQALNDKVTIGTGNEGRVLLKEGEEPKPVKLKTHKHPPPRKALDKD